MDAQHLHVERDRWVEAVNEVFFTVVSDVEMAVFIAGKDAVHAILDSEQSFLNGCARTFRSRDVSEIVLAEKSAHQL